MPVRSGEAVIYSWSAWWEVYCSQNHRIPARYRCEPAVVGSVKTGVGHRIIQRLFLNFWSASLLCHQRHGNRHIPAHAVPGDNQGFAVQVRPACPGELPEVGEHKIALFNGCKIFRLGRRGVLWKYHQGICPCGQLLTNFSWVWKLPNTQAAPDAIRDPFLP